MAEADVPAGILNELRALREERQGIDPDAQWMRLVLDHAPDAITVLEPDGTILYANHLASRGAAIQLHHTNTLDLVPEPERDRWQAALRSVVESGRLQSLEIESVSGFVWYARLVPIAHGGNVTSILCIATDRTAQRKAERELRRTEEDLRMALEGSEVALWRWNVQQNEILWNSVSRGLFSYQGPAPRFEDFLASVHPEDRARMAASTERVLATKQWRDLEYRLAPSADGATRWLCSRGHVILNDAGEVTVVLGASVDITRMKNLESQLRQSQKLEAIGQLAGGVAHDFNNLILAIEMNALAAERDPEESKSALAAIRLATEQAAALTRQLLAFSRGQAVTMSPLDLHAAIQDTLQLLRRVLPTTIEIDFIPAHGLSRVLADRSGVEQILTNLCVNARDAMPHGGRLTIETENVLVNGNFRDTHPWAQPGRYVLLSVSDTGTGMRPEVRERIFEPFFTTKESGQGTGLGLSTVYGIVKQHQGMVHVYSELGQGTTFKVYLPVAERSASDVGAKLAPEPGTGSETLLIAEDEPLVRNIVRRVLERAGYTVIETEDGEQALSTFRERRDEIALVLLDTVMPRKSGIDTLREIRDIAPDVPVILSTGYTDTWISNEPEVADVPVLNKPYNPDQLARAVRAAIDRSKL